MLHIVCLVTGGKYCNAAHCLPHHGWEILQCCTLSASSWVGNTEMLHIVCLIMGGKYCNAAHCLPRHGWEILQCCLHIVCLIMGGKYCNAAHCLPHHEWEILQCCKCFNISYPHVILQRKLLYIWQYYIYDAMSHLSIRQ